MANKALAGQSDARANDLIAAMHDRVSHLVLTRQKTRAQFGEYDAVEVNTTDHPVCVSFDRVEDFCSDAVNTWDK